MNEDLKDLLSRPTASVPDVGCICYGLSRNSAYAAAKSGDIPTIKIGKQLKVPTAPLRAKLGIEAA